MSNQLEVFITPVGTAVFPWITRSDTRYNGDGTYKTELSVPFEEAQSFIAKIEKVRDAHLATIDPAKQPLYAVQPVYTEEYTRPEFPKDATDEEKDALRKAHTPELTGNVLFKLKLNAKVTPRDPDKEAFTQTPVIIDAADGAAHEGPVYGGSVIRCKGQIAPYDNAMSKTVGVTLRMKTVQVIEAVGGSGGNSGFWTDFGDE